MADLDGSLAIAVFGFFPIYVVFVGVEDAVAEHDGNFLRRTHV